MIIELIIALIVGILCGTFTGLFPGIHINLVTSFLIASRFSSIPSLNLIVFIVALSITHIFIDFIPAILLGAPEEETFLSVLPGHQLVQEGKGFQATIHAFSGALFGIIFSIIIATPFALFLPNMFDLISKFMPYLLIFLSLYIILSDSIILSLVIFALSGIIGFASFNLPITQPLLPLLSGLFGIPALLLAMKQAPSLPKQTLDSLKDSLPSKDDLKKASASLISPFFSFLPGIGSGHASAFASELVKQTPKSFILLNAACSSSIMVLSFVTAYAIQKTRTGSSAAIQSLLNTIKQSDLLIILTVSLIAGIIAFFLGIFLSKIAVKLIQKIKYQKINLAVIFIIIAVNLLLTNFYGLIVLITAASLGLAAILSNSRRINLMGSLILPSIIYFLAN